jgi:DNA-binding NarL/FixJ family response regulator
MGSDAVKVLLVDDDADLRFMLRHLIEAATGHEVVGEAGDGLEAVEKVGTLYPDVVVMDVQMPNMDGIQATQQIKDRYPSIYVLGLTAFHDYPEAMLAVGAESCLIKTDATRELINILGRIGDERKRSPG